MVEVLDEYKIMASGVPAEVRIMRREDKFTDTYELKQIKLQPATELVLDQIKRKIIENVEVDAAAISDVKGLQNARESFIKRTEEQVKEELGDVNEATKKILVGKLVHELVGLGEMELLLADENLEEVVVNSAAEPVRVYHKKWGWLETNLYLESEAQARNYASIISRWVGRQITTLNPLLDARLNSGDRANATLAPISSKGISITIRKFAKNPWTIIKQLDPKIKTVSLEVAALVWLCMQYELNALVSGGTASGKTSILNAMLIFTPPNQRVISIEDTRELFMPDFLHWTPLLTRPPNPEGKGEITMLDLVVNSLRMRPDRIVVGEIRRAMEAEVLFEAMHTGHAVYATVHADSAEQVRRRLINPPIELPESVLGALHLIVVQYRDRRSGRRRTFEVAEVIPNEDGTVKVNVIYRWNPATDVLEKISEPVRLLTQLKMYAGMDEKMMQADLKEKQMILQYMLDRKITETDDIGRIVANYYRNREKVLEIVKRKGNPEELYRMKTGG
ncbi:Type II/IV secretion system protein [Candidatus Gugararchaeum adminiculabundum]|nr:Type II/IV secretion system protein [Candidatus Gugararchaeum adminiculabundum]